MTITRRNYADGRPISIKISDGSIESIVSLENPADDLAWIAPAFFDIQVNGLLGQGFLSDDFRADKLYAMRSRLAEAGTARWCPTVVTAPHEIQIRALERLAAAYDDPQLAYTIPSIHLEGPYLSDEDGPRGAHTAGIMEDPTWDHFSRLQEAAKGHIGMVTLAPERRGSVEFIEKAVAEGMVIAIGHTGASIEEIDAAVAAGARCSTHLGNGAHDQLKRHPNYLWQQLAADRLYASLIVDGHHLTPSVVKCFVRGKTPKRTILTSDCSHIAGSKPGRYRSNDHDVELLPSGKIVLAGTPYLAGSAILLDEDVPNAVRFADVSLSTAIDMASINPARLMDIDEGFAHLTVGADATLITYEFDQATGPDSFVLTGTLVRGDWAWQRT